MNDAITFWGGVWGMLLATPFGQSVLRIAPWGFILLFVVLFSIIHEDIKWRRKK